MDVGHWYDHHHRNHTFQNNNAFQRQNNSFNNRQQVHCVQENIHAHNMQPNECYSDNNYDYNIINMLGIHDLYKPYYLIIKLIQFFKFFVYN